MYWKIVRINGDGSIRLIYNETSANDSSFTIGSTPYNLNDDDPKYTGYTYDNGTDSFVKREIDTWYNNTLGKNSAYDSMVILGRFCSDSSGYNYDGDGSFASYDRLVQASSDFAKDNAPTFACPSTSESYGGSYRLKAGLITADELVYAGESYSVEGNSYLNSGQDGPPYWTMTPNSGTPYWTRGEGYSSSNYIMVTFLSFNGISHFYNLRPVINIKTDGMTLIGDGTMENPYTLQVAEQVEEPEESGSVDNNQENSFKNPETRSMITIGVTIGLIVVLGTGAFIIYRKKMKKN